MAPLQPEKADDDEEDLPADRHWFAGTMHDLKPLRLTILRGHDSDGFRVLGFLGF